MRTASESSKGTFTLAVTITNMKSEYNDLFFYKYYICKYDRLNRPKDVAYGRLLGKDVFKI